MEYTVFWNISQRTSITVFWKPSDKSGAQGECQFKPCVMMTEQ